MQEDRGPGGLPSSSRVPLLTGNSASGSAETTKVATVESLAFREGLIDELAGFVDFQGFDEGKEALDRLRAALEELERTRDGMDATAMTSGASGPGDVYSMMVALERQTTKVERRLDTLSHEALKIVSSSLVEINVVGMDDANDADDANKRNK